MNKIFYFLLFQFILQINLLSQSGWNHQNSGTTEKLNKVSLYNEKIGCIVGINGTILHTTNSGTTWKKQISGTNYNLHNLVFLDSLTIITIGDSGTILRTSNGGENWIKQTSGSIGNFWGISFLNKKSGFVVGSSVLFTSDEGLTWNIRSRNEINFTPVFVYYKDTNNIILLGSGYDVFVALSSDGGKTWITNYLNVVAPNIHFSDASFADSKIGYCVGYGTATSQNYPFLYKTTDGGASWQAIPIFAEIGINGIYSINVNIITFVGWGWGGSIHRSTDGGETFTVQVGRTKERLNSVSFVDSLTGSIVGNNGIILHTTNGGINTKFDSTITSINNFECSYQNNKVLLSWYAEIGADLSQFEIQRIYDVGNWTTIAVVSEGLQNQPFVYKDSNFDNTSKFIRYRIGIKKWDNSFSYSEVKVIILQTQLTEFEYTLINNVIELKWKANIDKSFSRFEVERSVNNKSWVKIAQVYKEDLKEDTFFFADSSFKNPRRLIKYRIKIINFDFLFSYSEVIEINFSYLLPTVYSLKQNYPNPFNPTTTIEYSIPEQTNVTLKIYDVLGREITTLVNEEKLEGYYKVDLNAASLPSGIYFYRLETGGFFSTKKLIVLK